MEDAEALMSWVFPNLYQHLDSFRGWTLFPGLKERLISASSTKRFFCDSGTIGAADAAGVNQFHFAIMTLARFFVNREARALTGALIFLDEERWLNLTAASPSPTGIMDAIAAGHAQGAEGYRDLAHAGWFALVQHIEDVFQMLDVSQRPDAISEEAWTAFKYEVLTVHAWRFELREPQLQARFRAISGSLGRVLAASEGGLSQDVVIGLKLYVDELVERWLRFTAPLQRAAGA
jgi:hypothetical protein